MVQHKNVLLASTAINAMDTLDGFTLNGSIPGDAWHSVSTSIVLPLAAGRVWHQPAGGRAGPRGGWISVSDAAPFAVPIAVNDTIALAVGAGAVAIRVVVLDMAAAQPGQPDTLFLKGDPDGLQLGAMRLVGYHSDPTEAYVPDPRDLALRFACLVKATEVAGTSVQALAAELAAAPVTSSVRTVRQEDARSGGAVWSLGATLVSDDGPVELGVDRNLTCSGGGMRNQTVHTSWNCLLKRRINGSDIVLPGTLEINGKPAPPIPPRAGTGF